MCLFADEIGEPGLRWRFCHGTEGVWDTGIITLTGPGYHSGWRVKGRAEHIRVGDE